MRRNLLQILLLFGVFMNAGIHVAAQKILLVTPGNKLFTIDPATTTCTTQEVTLPCTFTNTGDIFSVALYKDTIYYNTTMGYLYRSVLGNPSACKQLAMGVGSNALTVDKNGKLYWMTADLIKFDPVTLVKTDLGLVKFASGGDLVFYKDKLYLASSGLVEINLDDLSQSKIVLPTPGRNFYGLVNIPVGCNQNKIYGIEPMGPISNLVELDLENNKVLTAYCSFGLTVLDAASITESGIKPGITINTVDVKAQCGLGEKGSIQVNAITALNNLVLDYSLNSQANQTGFFGALDAGSYTVHIKSSDGCTLDTMINIPQADPIVVDITATPDTCGQLTGTAAVQKISGGKLRFRLDNSVIETNPPFKGLASGNHSLRITDENNCTVDAPFAIVPLSPPLPVSAIDIQPSGGCGANAGSIQLSYLASANILGAKLDNAAFSITNQFIGVAAGQHHLQIKTSTCLYDTMLTVPAKPQASPVISFMNKPPDCYNSSNGSSSIVVTNIASPFAVSFNNGAYVAATLFNGLAAGVYPISFKDANGCEWPAFDTIPSYQTIKPLVSTTVTDADCFQLNSGRAKLMISGVDQPYQFSIQNKKYSSGTEVAGLKPGTYLAGIFNANNCLVDSVPVPIKLLTNGANCDTVYVPSAFTPNGDGKNDLLKPSGNGLGISSQPFVFRVFNRLGQMLFENKTAGKGWDGKYQGIIQPPAVYVWTLEYYTSSDEKRVLTGTTVLIR